MGDPTNEEVYYGPMARLDLRDEHGQVLKTVEQGGRLVLGGIIGKVPLSGNNIS
jgi:succinate-semialdehyde dehydrogenase/glutarate-semialdehyde dehydrogenase